MSNNKLIAEFMGWDIESPTTLPSNLHLSNLELDNNEVLEYKYHTSWDWLMPVHKKCMFTPNFEGDDELRTYLIDAVIDADIDRLYDAVVEFIKEYNNG